jgi:hypothetical protein
MPQPLQHMLVPSSCSCCTHGRAPATTALLLLLLLLLG